MASERTAAQFGKLGQIRRDPMAMLPFCGYNMADYFGHWLNMGKRMVSPPKIFHVNWFRTDEKGRFIWPGYSENLRILEWILARCRNDVGAKETPIGYVPNSEDIDTTGLHIAKTTVEKLLAINVKDWMEELKAQKEFFLMFKDKLPAEIWQEYEALSKRFKV